MSRRSSFSIDTTPPPELVPYIKKQAKRSCTKQNILVVFDKLEGLKEYQRDILHIRYYPLFKNYQRRCLFYAIIFHLSRFIVTVGSITVPALLSIKISGIDYEWITWSISLAVTIFNGILTLFKIDKKYYFLHTTKACLESEGWQYVSLSGKYSKLPASSHDHTATNTHEIQFMNFCLSIEKIKMRQVEEEYYKAQESSGAPAASQPKTGTTTQSQSDMFSSALLKSSASAGSPQSQRDEMKQWMDQILTNMKESETKHAP